MATAGPQKPRKFYRGDLPLALLFIFFLLFSLLPLHPPFSISFVLTNNIFYGPSSPLRQTLSDINNRFRTSKRESFWFDSGRGLFSEKEKVSILRQMTHFPYRAIALRGTFLSQGIRPLESFLKELPFPVLDAQIFFARKSREGQSSNLGTPFLLTQQGPLSLAIFSINDPHLLEENSIEIQYVLKALSPDVIMEEMLSYFKKNNIDFKIVVSNFVDPHEEDAFFRKYHKRIDLVLSFCQRSKELDYIRYISNLPIVRVPCDGQSIGVVDFFYRNGQKNFNFRPLMQITDSDSLLSYDQQEHLNKIMGFNVFALTNNCDGESYLANFISDILLQKLNVDGVILNNSGFNPLPAGPISLESFQKAFPHEDQVVTFTLRGDELESVIMTGIQKKSICALLQVAGIRYRFDSKDKKRPLKITIAGKNLDPSKYYRIATTEYLIQRNDFSSFFMNIENKMYVAPLKKFLKNYIYEKNQIIGKKDKRIDLNF